LEAAVDPRFEQFIQEKKYLTNVSPATCEWYKQNLRWLPNSAPDAPALKDFVMRMRAQGLAVSSCNCRIRAVNSYLHWTSGRNTKCGAGCIESTQAERRAADFAHVLKRGHPENREVEAEGILPNTPSCPSALAARL
jgi:site-specific recombinase XerC